MPQDYSADRFVNLGALQSVEGRQRYEIPNDVAIEDFKSAFIGAASLMSPSASQRFRETKSLSFNHLVKAEG